MLEFPFYSRRSRKKRDENSKMGNGGHIWVPENNNQRWSSYSDKSLLNNEWLLSLDDCTKSFVQKWRLITILIFVPGLQRYLLISVAILIHEWIKSLLDTSLQQLFSFIPFLSVRTYVKVLFMLFFIFILQEELQCIFN